MRKCLGKTDKIPPFNIRKEDKDMIKRKIDRYLADFFETNKKALMLTGARQIGKITYLPIYMLMFIKKEQKLPTQYTIELSGLV